MKTIGTAKLTHLGDWIDYLNGLSADELFALADKAESFLDPDGEFAHVPSLRCPEWLNSCKNCLQQTFWPSSGFCNLDKTARMNEVREKHIERLRKIQEFNEEFDQPVCVGYWGKTAAYCYLGNADKGFVVLNPEKYLEFIPNKDWSDITPAQARAALCGGEMPATDSQIVPLDAQGIMTAGNLNKSLSAAENHLKDVHAQMEATERYETAELAELKKKIEAMETELRDKREMAMAKLESMLEEAERQKDALEAQIYMLDSQIYDICCYAGETVHFMRIKSGKNAPDSEPVVIHQKVRYLDEDLGRMASIYHIDWGQISMFEDFLRHNPYAQEVFCPNEKCVMLVRVSRTGALQKMSFYDNCQVLENYEYYHGRTIGIIIRNGENIYLGWTDQDRVHIKDDLIISQTPTEVVAEEDPPKFTFKSDKKKYYEQKKKERFDIVDGLVSRRFVYSVLQGVVDHSDLLSLPKGTNIGKQGPLVIHAIADMWLEDNRFGTFNDIVDTCNRHATVGDQVLTLCMLLPHSGQYEHNDRGIGYNNRTHDCEVPNCEILPINLVKDKKRIRRYRVRYQEKRFDGRVTERISTFDADTFDSLVENPEEFSKRYPGYNHEILEEFIEISFEVYVSVPKGDTYWREYRGTDPRANFRLDRDEYINLTFMNSVWLMYAINSKKLGGWRLDGKEVSYAYAIRYLNTALEFIREREVREKELLDAIDTSICEDPDWPVKLSRWKLLDDERPVREMNAYQAKRFVKYLKNH